ncbi:hypothetical protein DICPUDRAFT_92933 [Dictyostelium purpureum]|uniref:Uncharacterized protein n=1 Tax=Dictyostelium purpureum TaxID=5786 RepID=F0ZZH3_DICPU|nr:uncharacterized protein DICPUDRAFT_92933 [Dictyostelium purpureum]EGC30669.1 hypothetical protein DICPUDRAFT_92933 [Dictyostelium purpureum]|eukprot:XP_003292818.1 hypothetical protein DICPUDRAFT_92933 [Dictyostelium purpureum]
MDDNSKLIVNYNNANDILTINGNLEINSNYFSIIANQEHPNQTNNTMFIKGLLLTKNKLSVNLYFIEQPTISLPYQLFKLSSSNEHDSSLLSSLIKPILITNNGDHHSINTNLNLNSQYYFDQNNIAFAKFSLPPIVKHIKGWEIFLIILSCIAIVVLLVGFIYLYLNHKRYTGYLPV